MSNAIHLFAPRFRTDEILEEVRDCLEKGWTGLGYKTVELETAWKAHTELPNAHFLNSASAGLHLAVKLLRHADGWQDGDEVITTPLTFVSTNHPILYESLTPVFADVDEHLCLDPHSVAERITPRTRAIVFVGMGGNPGHLRDIVTLCRERELRLILDAAHMAGTWIGSRHVGREADVAVFSFHAVKNLPTADAGMICFADPDLDTEVRRWTWLGIDKDTYSRASSDHAYRWYYEVDRLGFKYHGNSIMAAMGLVGLRYLEEDNAHRRELAAAYDEVLTDCPGVERVPMAAGCTPSRHLYQVLVKHRDDVMVRLNERGIFPGVHYRDNTLYPMYAGCEGPCPRARSASASVISLPLHLRMTRSEVRRVTTALREITGELGKEATR